MKIHTSVFNMFIPTPKPGTQKIKERIENLDSFKGIDLSGGANIRIHNRSSENKVIISAEEEILPRITTRLNKDGNLKIVAQSQKKKHFNFDTPFDVDVFAQSIESLAIEGHCQVASDFPLEGLTIDLKSEGHLVGELEINAKQLKTSIQGAGELTLKGNVSHHTSKIEGAVTLKSKQLKTQTTQIDVEGPCKVDLFASEQLNLTANGLARVRVEGSPKIIEKESTFSSVDIQ